MATITHEYEDFEFFTVKNLSSLTLFIQGPLMSLRAIYFRVVFGGNLYVD